MMNLQSLLSPLLLLFGSVMPSYAQGFPWNDFKPRTLADIVKIDVREIDDSVTSNRLIFHGDALLSVISVRYEGKRRPISETKREMMKQWAQTFSVPNAEEYAAMYEEDILFTEKGVEYWLPVQKKVLPHFAKELKEGDEMDIYIVRAGGVCSKKVCDWMFLVEEFQKPKASVLP